jgi:general secretion pathway protein G
MSTSPLTRPIIERSSTKLVGRLVLSALVIASLAGVGIFIGGNWLAPRTDQTKIANSEFASLEGAVSQFQVDTGRFPTTAEGLAALITPPPGITNWHGPYLLHFPKDHWGHGYVYRCPSIKYPNGFDILSKGPDGIEGTADDLSNDVQDN